MRSVKVCVLFAMVTVILLSMGACKKKTEALASDGVSGGQDTGTIKIGMIFPFSGPNADQGDFNRNGAELAVEKINANGGIKSLGGKKLEVLFYDNQSSADISRTVAERLLSEHPDVVAIHGAASSPYVLPMLPTFEKNQVPFLTAQTSQTITNQGYQYTFAFACQAPQFAQTQVAMIEWLNNTYKLGISKIGIIYEDTEIGLVNSKAIRDEVQKSGLTLAYDKGYQAYSSDLSPIVVGLMDAGCEVIFPTMYTQDAKLLFNTMVSYKYSPLIVGSGAGFLYPVFARDVGSLIEGVLSVSTHQYDAKSVRQNTLFGNIGEEYEARFKEFFPEQAVSAFNAVYIVAQALEKTGSATDRVKLRDAIRQLTATSLTPGGALNFNKDGWNQNGIAVMVQWQRDQDGLFRPHSVFPPQEATLEFQLTDMLKNRIKN